MDDFTSTVELNLAGDMILIKASVGAINKKLRTKLSVFSPRSDLRTRVVKASRDMYLPERIQKPISFISLNHHSPLAFDKNAHAGDDDEGVFAPETDAVEDGRRRLSSSMTAAPNVTVSMGSSVDVILNFSPVCNFTSKELNRDAKPCNGTLRFTVEAQTYYRTSNNATTNYDPFPDTTNPMTFDIDPSRVYCVDSSTSKNCNGTTLSTQCSCYLSVSPLPQYVPIVFSVYSVDGSTDIPQLQGTSLFTVITKTATLRTQRDLYGVPRGLSVRHGSNLSLAAFYGQVFSNSDLETFLSLSGALPAPSIDKTHIYSDFPVKTNGTSNSNLQTDLNYAVGMATGAEVFVYTYVAENPTNCKNGDACLKGILHNEGFLTYLYDVGNQSYPPLVHTCAHFDAEDTVFNVTNPAAYEYGKRCDQQFLAMGLRGLTMIFATGNDGVGGIYMRDKDFQAKACSRAWPHWPASSPYVTAVGFTQLTTTHQDPICRKQYSVSPTQALFLASGAFPKWEVPRFSCDSVAEQGCMAATGGFATSHGGFSDVYDRKKYAPWQDKVVNHYLNSDPRLYPSKKLFNMSNRAIPDISMRASSHFTVFSGRVTRGQILTPALGSLVALWNDIRLANKKPPLGFLNPFLYQIYDKTPEAFNDVTTGINQCQGLRPVPATAPPFCCSFGYSAAPGWDAMTGLGTPNFQVIATLVNDSSILFPSSNFGTSSVASSYPSSEDPQKTDEETKTIATAALFFGVLSFVMSSGFIVYSTILGGGADLQKSRKTSGFPEPKAMAAKENL